MSSSFAPLFLFDLLIFYKNFLSIRVTKFTNAVFEWKKKSYFSLKQFNI